MAVLSANGEEGQQNKKGGRMRSANSYLRTAPKSQCGCGAINRDAKRRLDVRSASPFGNSRRSSQVAALLVDGLYRKSSFAMTRSSLGLLLTSDHNSTMHLDAKTVKGSVNDTG